MPNHEGERAKLLGKLSHRAWFEPTALGMQADVRLGQALYVSISIFH